VVAAVGESVPLVPRKPNYTDAEPPEEVEEPEVFSEGRQAFDPKEQPHPVGLDQLKVLPLPNREHLVIALDRSPKAQDLPEKLANAVAFCPRIPIDGADLQGHSAFAELLEPPRTQRILFSFSLPKDEFLEEVAVRVGHEDLTRGRHKTTFSAGDISARQKISRRTSGWALDDPRVGRAH
jgi:hypothetical protein